jgi:AAA family ATP:ADP antiporter
VTRRPDPDADPSHPHDPRGLAALRRIVAVEPREVAAVGWSCLYFFSVLSAWYLLRPLRDDMGVVGGTKNLAWLYMGTLSGVLIANPIYATIVSRYPRRRFIPYVYRFFELNLLAFFVLLHALPQAHAVWAARAFFIWASVFNMFVVALFWSFMADLFSSDQGKRLFGFIAVGGTLGAVCGSAAATLLARPLGPLNLILIAICLLELAVFCVGRLGQRTVAEPAPPACSSTPVREADETLALDSAAAAADPDVRLARGGMLGGIRQTLRSPYLLGICAYMTLFTVLSTFAYFQQARIVDAGFANSADRTTFFARIDLYVNILGALLQVALTGRIVRALGVGPTLIILPALTAAGFGALAFSPTVGVLMAFQVVRRATEYGLARPAREVLYTVVQRDEKYKAKGFIDTFVYRAGDAVGAWTHELLARIGEGTAVVAAAAAPIAAAWAAVGLLLGRAQNRRAAIQASLHTDAGPSYVAVPAIAPAEGNGKRSGLGRAESGYAGRGSSN